MYGYYAYDNGRGILAVRNSGADNAVCRFDHKGLSFEDGAYEICEFYPHASADKRTVSAGEILNIDLKPFEIKLFNIALVE